MTRSKLTAGVAAALILATAGCGGGSGGRPSTDQLSAAIQKSGGSLLGSNANSMTKTAADCLAKALHDSKVSDDLLNAVISQKKDFKPSASDTAAMSTVVPQITKCMPSLGSVTP